METAKKIRLSNFYISYTNTYGKTIRDGNFSLKHDYYDRDTLLMIESLSKTEIPSEYKMIENPTTNTFVDNMARVLVDMDNDKIDHFFCNTLAIYKKDEKPGLDIVDSRGSIIQDDNGLRIIVTVPERSFETDCLHAVTAHELAHFSMYLGKDRCDTYEYCEALSMFFEYMIYCSINGKENGSRVFENNRLFMLKDTFSDLRDDIFYALNPQYLEIDSRYYKVPLAISLAYPESLEYTLQLIERRKEDKKYVDDYIGSILLGYETTDAMAYDLDIDTSNYPKLSKLLR